MNDARLGGYEGKKVIEGLYDLYRKPLLTFFQRRLSAGEAEDFTQDVFVRLSQHPDLQALTKPESYIFQVAANLLRDAHRKSHSHASNRHDSLETIELNTAVPKALVEEIDPERVLLGRSGVASIGDALKGLPERTRDIFLLYRLERMRQRDIAARLGISVSSVEKHLSKAIAILTKAYVGHE